nr:MAG: capsid protein [Enontekio totivirus 5]
MSFKQDGWGCGLTQLGNIAAEDWWNGIWHFRVPYLLDAYCCAWALERWPYVFGVFQRDVSIDVKADCILSGALSGWYASRGCGAYKSITMDGKGARPWYYENYGLSILNALCQEWSRDKPPAIQFQRWSRGFDSATVGPCLSAADAYSWELDFIRELGTIRPGVIRNYDWFEDQSLSPSVPQFSWTTSQWASLRVNSVSNLRSVGLLNCEAVSVPGGALGSFDALSLYGGADDSAQPAPSTEN